MGKALAFARAVTGGPPAFQPGPAGNHGGGQQQAVGQRAWGGEAKGRTLPNEETGHGRIG